MRRHQKPPSTPSLLTRRSVRLGLFAAGVASVATAAPAQASTHATASGVAIAQDHTFTHADPLHHTQVKDTFTVQQFGSVKSADVRNQANAVSVGCSADAHCRSVALSFQIVTMANVRTHLNAVNVSDAANQSCTGCQTLAGAYQFIVSTSKPFTLDQNAQRRLTLIHQRLDALTRSTVPAADLKRQVDALADEVTGVLHNAAATAPHAGAQPVVTMHRHLDGWPAH